MFFNAFCNNTGTILTDLTVLLVCPEKCPSLKRPLFKPERCTVLMIHVQTVCRCQSHRHAFDKTTWIFRTFDFYIAVYVDIVFHSQLDLSTGLKERNVM